MNQRTPIKIATIVVAVLTLIAVVGISLLTFWRLQDPAVLEINHGTKDISLYPFPVRPDSNVAGQVEFMHVNYCKTFSAKGKVVARMVGKKSIIPIPWPVESQQPQCLDTEVPIVIPTYATDDTYYFDFTVTYRINPIKEKEVYLRSETFEVMH